VYVTAELERDDYLFICRVPDAGDGRSHGEHGMRTEVGSDSDAQRAAARHRRLP
jgi:hypothetical protein